MSERRSKPSADTGRAAVDSVLEPLHEGLRDGRAVRLVARPGSVSIDRVEGTTRVEVDWDAERHQAALEGLAQPRWLADGTCAAVAGNAVVLHAPYDATRRSADLVRDGRLSTLAANLLTASLELGRNLLVTGPYCASLEIMGALLAEGRRPAVLAHRGDAVPPGWLRAGNAEDATAAGADRIAVWSGPMSERVLLMEAASGVLCWIDARRLDRALLRFEAEAERSSGRANAPLHVLAAVDLVVVVSAARVSQIAEIQLVEDGYRPRLLFSAGMPPVPTTLVPVAAPSFLDELSQAGQGVLADELRHAVPTSSRPEAVQPRGAADTRRAARAGGEAGAANRTPRPPPEQMDAPSVPYDPSLADAPPPGWELDRLGDAPVGESEAAMGNAEDAELAASFGLGPPPAPPGATSAETRAERSSFADALRRARERNEQYERGEDEDER